MPAGPVDQAVIAQIRRLVRAPEIVARTIRASGLDLAAVTLRLCLLAPDIVEALLDGSQPPTLRLADIEAPFPIEWDQQRRQFGLTPRPTQPESILRSTREERNERLTKGQRNQNR